jgi:prepilin-type N-terminal cleavage/methylation domain-containing protein
MRHRAAFTLIEVMIASAITLVIVAIAMQFAGNMSLEARRLEQQGDLAARMAIANSFLTTATDGIGYGWDVQHDFSGKKSGSFGTANCPITAVCPAATALPFQVCAPGTAGAGACAAQTSPTNTGDALRFWVPRDGVIEAVRIVDRNATALPTDCNLGSTQVAFDVKGTNPTPWEAGDLVLVSNTGHVSIFSVHTAFAAGTDASVTRVLTLANVTGLADDDGGSTTACNATASLKRAGVFRIRLGVVRINQANRTLDFAELVNTGGTFAFQPVISDVDDFQVRLDLQQFTVDNSTKLITGVTLCSADAETALTTNQIAGCSNNRMNALAAEGNIVRLAGLRLGLILRSRGSVDVPNTFRGLFDRTAVIGTDQRMRRTIFLFAGLPNALL